MGSVMAKIPENETNEVGDGYEGKMHPTIAEEIEKKRMLCV